MLHPTRMSAGDTGLLVIDVQEKLMAKIPDASTITRNMAFLIDCAQAVGLTVQATEQYPKGLGGTVADLASRLPNRPEKLAFSCCAVAEVIDRFRQAGCHKILLCGIEAHVCVQQTALDLLALDFRVYLAADAISSRYAIDRDFAFRRLERAGCILTTCEAAAFEWLGGSDHPSFKQVSRLVQERMKDLAEGTQETDR
ncbi:MAG: hydrolase [Gemmatales bacterium]|nr:MAG: hydrolase [Gemmatales bacterium]